MQNLMLMDRYPVSYREFAREECRFGSVDEIVDYFRKRIADDPMGGFIGVFDQCAHTAAVGGTVAPQVSEAKNVVFCFGHALPNAQILALKPRSIGVAQVGDRFGISFMQPPNAAAQSTMEEWVNGLAA